MKRFVCGCQRFGLCAAFVAVMGGAGGFLGATGGLVLLLISHAVFGMSAGMVEMMAGSVGAGTVLFAGLAGFLLARQFLPLRGITNYQLRITNAEQGEVTEPKIKVSALSAPFAPSAFQPQLVTSSAVAPGVESNQVAG